MSNVINPAFRQVAIKGKSKLFYKSDNIGEFFLTFSDENPKLAMVRNKISQIIFELLEESFIPTHFIKAQGINEQIVHALDVLPFKLSIYSFTNKDLSQRLGCSENIRLKNHLIEFNLKGKDNSLISLEHIVSFEWLTRMECAHLQSLGQRVMDIVYGFFKSFGIVVSSLTLEFGKGYNKTHDIMLAGEMSFKNIKFFIPDLFEEDDLSKNYEMAKRLGVFKYE